jgi:hypothetical protein
MRAQDIRDADAAAFVRWLQDEVIAEARGDRCTRLPVAPRGRFWLGRVAPEVKVRNSRLGERAERLEPCEVGLRIRPTALDGRTIHCIVRMVAWRELDPSDDPDADKWEKTTPVEVAVDVGTPRQIGDIGAHGRDTLARALSAVGANGLSAEVQVEAELGKSGHQLAITVVNQSPEEIPGLDTNLYEVELEAQVGPTLPFLLDELEDSFRYGRTVAAYGLNGGVRQLDADVFVTSDMGEHDRNRSEYWDTALAGGEPDLTFIALADDPIPRLREFVDRLDRWTASAWSASALARQAEQDGGWSEALMEAATQESRKASVEADRVRSGLALLEDDARLRRAFQLANRSFADTPAIRHDRWRAFQLGFLLANISSLDEKRRTTECAIVDTLWFATGGGKTETYLLFTLTAAFYDRLRGKSEGITSWGRFPLRMLSLQQTQRFADVFAAAELIRRKERLPDRPFSVGFLVGEPGTPNRIKKRDRRPADPDPKDPTMPARYRVLIRCPFCTSEDITMRFDEGRWALDHLCRAPGCPSGGKSLPFRIVDDEIYRSLPTVVIGTLDKAASVAIQAAMRGFYGAPEGRCSDPKHGFTYAPRSKTQNGCLFPDCTERVQPLAQDPGLYAPSIRMQDELHLLRDSLGSVDAHYEALLDDLQKTWHGRAKIIASSATLAGHDRQVQALYQRDGRMFPLPGPRADRSFWSTDSGKLARRYVGLAPRGVTLEYAKDQLTETLQRAVRRALADPTAAAEVGVPEAAMPGLVWAYGVDVVYGTTLKDVEAAARSFDAQIQLDRVNAETLTGRVPLDEVRTIMARLTEPEVEFLDRIHLIAASSMLSHGVDIDRLNIITMLGLPLSTAEFIQTTARVGRTLPGLVFVLHKIARERDAAVFRIFPSFIQHMDRLVDPVPITAKSRRILELTFPGLEQSRIYGVHEHAALLRQLKQLTTPRAVKRAFAQLPVNEPAELQALIQMLGFQGPLDENLRQDLTDYVRHLYRELNDPASDAKWVSDLFLTEPMLSLRDVEDQVEVYSRRGRT